MSVQKKLFPKPLDSGNIPRFSGLATFMRLPVLEDFNDVDIAIVGVPWDGGTSNRPGPRHGPRQVRDMSSFVRLVNGATGVSPYELCRVADLGDAPVNPIDLHISMDKITGFFKEMNDADTTPLAVGGDHLMSLPILRALAAKHGPLGMLHFDAHSDTIDTYFDGLKYTHGTPFRRAIEEGLLDPKRIVQIGLRGSVYDKHERDWPREQGIHMITMDEFEVIGIQETVKQARQVVGDQPTYLTFDIDVIDPVFVPGTGTPEIGGLTTREAFLLLRGLRGLNLIGADLPEVSPPFDQSGNTALVGANMLFELLCLLAESRSERA